jgi:uncharacterized protein YaaW (UPF0174 family)
LDELRQALELATPEELQQLTKLLFDRKLNPLDYFTPEPIEVQSRESSNLLDTLESRFRYLASDGMTVLRGKTEQFSYRDALIKVCHFLKIPYSKKMNTTEIEAEIFLELVSKTWKSLPKQEQHSINFKIKRTLAAAKAPEPIPSQLLHNPLTLVLKGSSAVALSSLLKPWLLRQVAQQLALHIATYQAAQSAIVAGGAAAAAEISNQLALQVAKRGIINSTARYGAVKTVLSVAGPVLWGWFLADLGWRAISTNYSRIIPMVYTLAQIRLTRSDYWEMA